MLTLNYIWFYAYVLLTAGAFWLSAYNIGESFFGFPQYFESKFCKTEEIRKRMLCYNRVQALFIICVTVMILIWKSFACMQDIPQLMAGQYSVTEGEVTEIGGQPQEGYTIRGDVKILDDFTGKVIEFEEIYIPYIEPGSHVKIAHLTHSRMGVFLEADGRPVYNELHSGKPLVLFFMILATGYINFRMFHIIKRKIRKKWNGYYVLIYQEKYVLLLFLFGMAVLWGDILLIASMCGFYKKWVSTVWTLLVFIYLIIVQLLFIIRQQRFTIYHDKIVYCNFRKRYRGTFKDVQKISLVEKKLIVTASGKELMIEAMDTIPNQEFLKLFQMELNQNISTK